jgi:hypothetical protein
MRSPGCNPALAAAVFGMTAVISGENFANHIVARLTSEAKWGALRTRSPKSSIRSAFTL